MDKLERYLGCLLGLAVGDALGTALEFKPPGSFDPINDIVDPRRGYLNHLGNAYAFGKKPRTQCVRKKKGYRIFSVTS